MQSEAVAQMKLYTDVLQTAWPSSKPWFMTMGNHECGQYPASNCLPEMNDPNFDVFFAAMKSVSKQTALSYKLDFTTRHGLVRMVVVADNSDTAAARAQVAGWLAEADTAAFATIVVRHYTVDGSRDGPPWAFNLFKAHKATVALVAHAHLYRRNDVIVRTTGALVPTVVCGLGAANPAFRGFCRLQQQADGAFKITQYSDTGLPLDTFSVQGQK
jgi:hypothetical protein